MPGHIRTIKPSFFLNEDLAKLPPLDRIAFEGLWCHADRQGRLHDRSVRLKVQILPYDDWDFDKALARLAEAGFITRYSLNGSKFIQVNTFVKHQRPHHTEGASEIPDANGEVTVSSPLDNGEVTVSSPINPEGREGKGKEGNGVGKGKEGEQIRAPGSSFVPPTIEEVRTHAAGLGYATFDAEHFIAHHETRGWKLNGRAMVSWKAAVVTWHKNDAAFGHKPTEPGAAAPNPLGIRASKDGASMCYRGEWYHPHRDGKRWLTEDGYRPDGTNIQTDASAPKLNEEVYQAMSALVRQP